jgi:hypothetical protein
MGTKKNTNAKRKLDETAVKTIIKQTSAARGAERGAISTAVTALAKKYDVSVYTIHAVMYGRSWKDLPR